MPDPISTPAGLPPNGGVKSTTDPEAALTPTRTDVRQEASDNFETFLQQSSVTTVERQQFEAEVNVAKEIEARSGFVDLGKNQPV